MTDLETRETMAFAAAMLAGFAQDRGIRAITIPTVDGWTRVAFEKLPPDQAPDNAETDYAVERLS